MFNHPISFTALQKTAQLAFCLQPPAKTLIAPYTCLEENRHEVVSEVVVTL